MINHRWGIGKLTGLGGWNRRIKLLERHDSPGDIMGTAAADIGRAGVSCEERERSKGEWLCRDIAPSRRRHPAPIAQYYGQEGS